jgi:hypothetical protein
VRLAAVLAAAVVAVGCGGKQPDAQSPAEVAPSDAYALLTGDPADVRGALTLLSKGRQLAALFAHARAAAGGRGAAIAVLDDTWTDAVAITRGAAPHGLPHARVRGWTVYSLRRASVEAVRHAKQRLADTSWYRPVNGDVTFQLRGLTITGTRDGDRETAEEGVRVSHDVEHRLASLIPEDAVAAAAFDRPPTLSFADELERGLGVSVLELDALAPNGGVAYLRPGEPVPTVTLLTVGGTIAAARRVVRELDPSAPAGEPAELDGVPLEVAHLGAIDLYYGRFGDALVFTDDPALRLHDVSALSPEGLPDKTQEWYYLTPEQGLPALRSLAALAGTHLSRSFEARISPFESVLSYRANGKLTVRVE